MDKILDKNSKFIADVILGKKIDRTKRYSLDKMLRKASHNRVLYQFAKRILDSKLRLEDKDLLKLEDIKRKGEFEIKKLQRTLEFINETLKNEKIEYLISKTYKYMPYVTFDVDVLVRFKDFERVKQVFSKNGLKIEKHPGKQSKNQVNCFGEGLLKIDLHQDFSWQGDKYFDLKSIWKRTRIEKIQDVNCPIPSKEIELVLNLIHVLYERRYVSLLDLNFFVQACKEKVNIKWIKEQSKKHKWDESLENFLVILGLLENIVYGSNYVLVKSDDKTKKILKYVGKRIGLPYLYPMPLVIKVFLERFRKKGRLPKFDFAYYFFTTFRYYVTGLGRLPYYLHWYRF